MCLVTGPLLGEPRSPPAGPPRPRPRDCAGCRGLGSPRRACYGHRIRVPEGPGESPTFSASEWGVKKGLWPGRPGWGTGRTDVQIHSGIVYCLGKGGGARRGVAVGAVHRWHPQVP